MNILPGEILSFIASFIQNRKYLRLIDKHWADSIKLRLLINLKYNFDYTMTIYICTSIYNIEDSKECVGQILDDKIVITKNKFNWVKKYFDRNFDKIYNSRFYIYSDSEEAYLYLI